MPFLTEELWHAVYDGSPPAKSIALTRYPQASQAAVDSDAISQMALLQSLIVEVRGLRKEIGVEEKAVVPIEVQTAASTQAAISANSNFVERLGRVSEIRFVPAISEGLAKHSRSEEHTSELQSRRD